MDLQFISQFTEPIAVAICLCAGYIIKTSLDFIPNKYIPLIMAVLGLCITALSKRSIDADVILTGLCSGLASTGVHQAVKNLSKTKGKTEQKIAEETNKTEG